MRTTLDIPIIFLDIDGVLNGPSIGRDGYGPLFSADAMNAFESIMLETQAQIVISSDWRLNGLQFIKDMWRDRGYVGASRILDITTTLFDSFHFPTRGHEIHHWQECNMHIGPYVIIDDMEQTNFMPQQRLHLVKVLMLNQHDAKKCIELINAQL